MKTVTVDKDTAEIKCLNNDTTLLAEILDYKHAYMLTVSVDRKVKVSMRYNTGTKTYRGNVGSLEFESAGPQQSTQLKGRF